jgi:protein-L-isoaspartate(D-aspartate) O-methyltransferase
LEIGTGSGYQAAILCKMGVRVFSIERQRILYRKSKQLLSHISCKADVRYGDGFKGIPQFAPYQGIIITCGAPHIPESLIDQLALNGRMVVPLGEGSHQEMVVVYKDKDGKIHQTKHGSFAFVPMLKDKAK